MSETSRGDSIRINGSGTYSDVDCEAFTGDLYATRVRIAGTATVEGNATGEELDVDGSLKIGEDLRSETVEIDGTTKIHGSVTADRLTADGTLKIEANASVNHLSVDGTGKIGGNLDAHEIRADGTLKIGDNLVAANAHFDGTGTVGGLTDVTELTMDGTGTFGDVNAETATTDGAFRAADVAATTFDLTLAGDSSADSVRATDIHVRRRESGLSSIGRKFLNRGDSVFEVGVVEAQTADLDATRATVVVGEHVTLGPDTHVETVYADADDLDVHHDARVDDVRPYEEY